MSVPYIYLEHETRKLMFECLFYEGLDASVLLTCAPGVQLNYF